MAAVVRKTYFILMVADMDRAVGFYTGAFGASVSFSSPHWSEVTLAGATVALHPGASGDQVDTGLGLEVDDLAAALADAERAGGRVVTAPRDRPGERIQLATLADPEGNVLTVAEPRGRAAAPSPE